MSSYSNDFVVKNKLFPTVEWTRNVIKDKFILMELLLEF